MKNKQKKNLDLNELVVWQYPDQMLSTFYEMQRQYQDYYSSTQENLQTEELRQQVIGLEIQNTEVPTTLEKVQEPENKSDK